MSTSTSLLLLFILVTGLISYEFYNLSLRLLELAR